LASSLTSLATTAKPLPASPARAASIVALSARRLVCWAIVLMTFVTLPIAVAFVLSAWIVWLAPPASSLACRAVCADSLALLAISLIVALISSDALATDATFPFICSAALTTLAACAAVCVALAATWLETAVRDDEVSLSLREIGSNFRAASALASAFERVRSVAYFTTL